ncbi:MAG: hypothetical protein IT285_06700 [Bdellovibrionales bacterium]|nr:hypothetical protein [Bdellovibrionales bacterium]
MPIQRTQAVYGNQRCVVGRHRCLSDFVHVFNFTTITLLAVLTAGCATLKGTRRIVTGATGGAALGASGGLAFSPNEESRGMNALVFGLSGALAGGAIALLTDTPETESKSARTFREREQSKPDLRLYTVEPTALTGTDLPPFVRQRIAPLLIEETTEGDSIAEDGALHEPHKVYRVLRPAELFARPAVGDRPQPTEGENQQ